MRGSSEFRLVPDLFFSCFFVYAPLTSCDKRFFFCPRARYIQPKVYARISEIFVYQKSRVTDPSNYRNSIWEQSMVIKFDVTTATKFQRAGFPEIGKFLEYQVW